MDTLCTTIKPEWVSIFVDLFIAIGVGYILACVIPKKLNDDRTLKDFFIDELRTLKNEHNEFCKEMCLGKLNATTIIESYKQFKIRLTDVEYIINSKYELGFNMQNILSENQIFITGTNEINDNYEAENVSFCHEVKTKISFNQDVFNRNMMSAIVSLNDSSRK